MEALLEVLEQNGVHDPRNQCQLVRMKYLLKNKSMLGGEIALLTRSIRNTEKKMVSTSQKFGFHQTERSIYFKNKFSPDRKIKWKECMKMKEKIVSSSRKISFH